MRAMIGVLAFAWLFSGSDLLAKSTKRSKKASKKVEAPAGEESEKKEKKGKEKEKEKEKETVDAKIESEKAQDIEKVQDGAKEKEPPSDRVEATAPAPVEAKAQPIPEKSEGKFYLTFGVGRSLDPQLKIAKKTTNAGDGRSTTQNTAYNFSGGAVFTLDLMHYKPGSMGYSIGVYLDQPGAISSVQIDDGSGAKSAATQSEVFSQFGGQLNVMLCGNIPYAYLGANFGSATLKSQDSEAPKAAFKGELGGQAGLGLRLGKYLAIEGSFRVTQFTLEEESEAGLERSSSVMNSGQVTIKALLN